jgi:alkylation response protein AidB-like acyl-CoA dehydrogenase
MPLSLTEEQEMLSRSAAEFLADRASLAQFRVWRERTHEQAFDPELWREIVGMGWPGIALSESQGGAGLGFAGLGIVFEQLGRHLSVTPMNSTVLCAATTIQLLGSAQEQAALLPQIIAGSLTLSLAWDERAHFDPCGVATTARSTAGGWLLSGCKRGIADVSSVDRLLVVCRLTGEAGDCEGRGVFIVPRSTARLRIEATPMVDGRNCGEIVLDGVELGREALLGGAAAPAAALERLADIINAGLAAELLGISEEAFARTLRYLKERSQFGKLIGSYQALQHRAANWFVELQLARSLVQEALLALDAEPGSPLAAQGPALASMAKTKAAQVAELATNEAIQMHGGIGMTDAHDIGLYIKRARTLEQAFGDQSYHLDRLASLEGY